MSGVGGPDGQETFSYGYGKTPEEAIEAAETELFSYSSNISRDDIVSGVESFKSSKVLVLDGVGLSNLGLQKKDVVFTRNSMDSYLIPNIISDVAKKHKYDFIQAPSSPGSEENRLIIHMIRGSQ